MPPLTRTIPPGGSRALQELYSFVTPADAVKTLMHSASREGRSAETNVHGCWLMRHRDDPNHISIYIKLTAESMRLNKLREKDSKGKIPRLSSQLIHRLACRAWKTERDLELMFVYGHEVSHLCHQKHCFNPQHLVVERSRDNCSRNICNIRRRCVCGLSPPCIV